MIRYHVWSKEPLYWQGAIRKKTALAQPGEAHQRRASGGIQSVRGEKPWRRGNSRLDLRSKKTHDFSGTANAAFVAADTNRRERKESCVPQDDISQLAREKKKKGYLGERNGSRGFL